ncbi:unnamed protein product [Arctogadus glacialis]
MTNQGVAGRPLTAGIPPEVTNQGVAGRPLTAGIPPEVTNQGVAGRHLTAGIPAVIPSSHPGQQDRGELRSADLLVLLQATFRGKGCLGKVERAVKKWCIAEGTNHLPSWCGGSEALEAFGNGMTKYEQKEIKGYNDIWFLGLHAMKIQGSRHTGNFNHGFDNEQYFYEQVSRDHIAYRYEVLGVLGKGVYGQVLKCFDHQHNELVALKLLRNQPRYHRLGKEERRILQLLRDKDPEDDHHVVRMKDSLVFWNHICISFELLGSDMHAMHTKKGESVSYVRKCAYPILKCLQLLKRENIMHSDLKLANMVMSGKDPDTLKVIDFGLSLVQDEPRYYSRIQTRSIRAPEVTLGLLCTTAIDMWSFGCCLIELLIGREAFSGDEEYEQLTRTIEILGMPPEELVALSSQRNVFFDERGTLRYIRVNNSGEKLLPGSERLESLLGTSDPDLLDFIKRCLHWDSSKRMTPGQALEHAWMMKTSLGCMSPTPGNPPKTVMLKTPAATTTQHLKPDMATGSQPQTMDQGEMDKLGKHGRTLRPLTSELDPLLPPIGATGPAPPPRGKGATVTPDGDEEGMLKHIRLNISVQKILPGSDTLENLLGIRVPDLLDFMQPRLQTGSSTKRQAVSCYHRWWCSQKRKSYLQTYSPSAILPTPSLSCHCTGSFPKLQEGNCDHTWFGSQMHRQSDASETRQGHWQSASDNGSGVNGQTEDTWKDPETPDFRDLLQGPSHCCTSSSPKNQGVKWCHRWRSSPERRRDIQTSWPSGMLPSPSHWCDYTGSSTMRQEVNQYHR